MTAIRMTATAERLPPLGRALRTVSILLGVLAFLFVITVPLNGEQQADLIRTVRAAGYALDATPG